MAQKTRAQLDALIAANLPDNVSKLITPIKHREVEVDLTDSNVNRLDDLIASSAGPSSAGKVPITNGSGQLDSSFIPGGGGGSAAWGDITGTLSAQTDLQDALDAKAPSDSPVITGNVEFDVAYIFAHITGVDDAFFVDETGFQFSIPIVEKVLTIGNSDSTTIPLSTLVVEYNRADLTDIVVSNPGDASSGQNLKITNSTSGSVVIGAPGPNAFFDGAAGVVSSITLASKETICFVAIGSNWRVFTRYLSSGGSGDVVGPAGSTAGHIAVFADTTGKLLDDSGIVALDSVTTSAGAGDAGKLPALNASGVLDSSFLSGVSSFDMLSTLTAAEIAITNASTPLTISRAHAIKATSADQTNALPAASGNTSKFSSVRITGDTTKFVTIDGNGSTIDGASSRVMWAGESAIFYCDGANYFKIAGRALPMAAGMHLAGAQSIPDQTQTQVALDTTDFDNTGAMASTGSNQITVKRTGIYTISGSAQFSNITAASINIQCSIYVNGSKIRDNAVSSGQNSYPSPTVTITKALTAGDVVAVFAYENTSASQNLYVASPGNGLSVTEVVSW